MRRTTDMVSIFSFIRKTLLALNNISSQISRSITKQQIRRHPINERNSRNVKYSYSQDNKTQSMTREFKIGIWNVNESFQ